MQGFFRHYMGVDSKEYDDYLFKSNKPFDSYKRKCACQVAPFTPWISEMKHLWAIVHWDFYHTLKVRIYPKVFDIEF